MKITGLRTYISNSPPQTKPKNGETRASAFKTWMFVKIETDAGISGWGEGSGEWLSPIVEKAVHEYEPMLVGRDPTDFQVLWEDLQNRLPWKGGSVFGSAVAAIDMALHDITGKAWGVPVYKLLGGRRRDRVRVYDGGIAFGSTPAEARAKARADIERGSRAMKGVPLEGRGTQLDRDALMRASDVLHAVRDEVGDEIALMIDCHASPLPELSILLAELVADTRPLFLEEPCKVGSVEALEAVKSKTTIPIATGEKLYSVRDFKELIDRRSCAILQPDGAHAFGITGLRRIGAAAAEQQMLMAPHGGIGPVYFAALMHADAAMQNFLIQEGSTLWHTPWFDDLVEHDWVLDEGYIELNDRPGLGIEVNEEAVAARAYDEPMPFRQYRHVDGSWAGW